MQCGCWNWPLGPLLMVSALKLNFSPIETWLHELWPKLSWICGFGVTQWFRHRQATKLKVETEKIPQPPSLAYYPLVSLLSPRLFGHLSGHIRLLTLHLKAGDMRAVYCRPWNQISWVWIVAPPPHLLRDMQQSIPPCCASDWSPMRWGLEWLHLKHSNKQNEW